MSARWYQPMVAVSGLIWRGAEVLFLRRVQPPLVWVPPGGRMEAGEEPRAALLREIQEETGLERVDVVAPCIVEAGHHDGRELLFLDFACAYAGGEIALDRAEHDAWRWLHMEKLAQAEVEVTQAAGGEPIAIFRWGDEELRLSHSLEQLRLSRRILDCLKG